MGFDPNQPFLGGTGAPVNKLTPVNRDFTPGTGAMTNPADLAAHVLGLMKADITGTTPEMPAVPFDPNQSEQYPFSPMNLPIGSSMDAPDAPPTDSGPITALMREIIVARDKGNVLADAARVKPTPADKRAPFSHNPLDLSLADSGNGFIKRLDTPGYRLLYKREGSTPGGRLDIPELGVRDFYPGEYIEGYFEGFGVFRSARSTLLGTAVLVVHTSPDVQRNEPNIILPGETFPAVDLLGTTRTQTYVTVLVDTIPALVGQAGSFDVTGIKLIRVHVDGNDGALILQSIQIRPWFFDTTLARWGEVGTEAIALPDVSPALDANRRFRSFVVPLTGAAGRLFLEPLSVGALPAAQANLKYIVQAIG
jgi:hypothetical protein